MDEFTKQYFTEQQNLLENVIVRINNNGDRFSKNAVSNLVILMRDFHLLVGTLFHDIETKKVEKTPKRLKTWKKKKRENVEKTKVEDANIKQVRKELEKLPQTQLNVEDINQTQPYPEETLEFTNENVL